MHSSEIFMDISKIGGADHKYALYVVFIHTVTVEYKRKKDKRALAIDILVTPCHPQLTDKDYL